MGEYFYPCVSGNFAGPVGFKAHDYDNGLKLMEHSYMGNELVNAVLGYMVKVHQSREDIRVVWISDYAIDREFKSDDRGAEEFVHDVQSLFKEDSMCWTLGNPKAPPMIICCPSRKEYVHVHGCSRKGNEDYIKEFNERYKLPVDEWDCTISPLPLLTMFNVGGGGDYMGTHMELRGVWAGLKLTLCDINDKTEQDLKDWTCLDGMFIEQY